MPLSGRYARRWAGARAVRPRCGHPAAAHAVMRQPTPSHRAAAAIAAVAVAAVARAAPPARQPTSKQDPPHRAPRAKPPLRARATVAAQHDTSDLGPCGHTVARVLVRLSGPNTTARVACGTAVRYVPSAVRLCSCTAARGYRGARRCR